MIGAYFTDKQVIDKLNEMIKRGSNLRPILYDIGEYLVVSSKQRFSTRTAPDGTRWKDNAETTIERKGSNQPLIGESRRLSNEIHYTMGKTTVSMGSSPAYARIQQEGGLKSAYPHLWGNIPARPYLGLSDDDEQVVREILQEHLVGPLGG